MTKTSGYEGFETFYNPLKMSLKMYWVILKVLIGVYIVISFSLIFYFYDVHRYKVFLFWITSKLLVLFSNPVLSFPNSNGSTAKLTAYAIAHSSEIYSYIQQIVLIYKYCLFTFMIYPVIVYYFIKKSHKLKEKKYIRGAKILSKKEYKVLLKKAAKKYKGKNKKKVITDLPFGKHLNNWGKIEMPIDAEPKPVAIIGRPGVGKTVLISQVITRIIERGDRAVIYDFKGDMISRFYNPDTDIIINPLDKRSTGWGLLQSEIKTKMDINSCAASLIPLPHTSSSADPYFNEGARDVFAGILHYLYENDFRTNKDIWDLVSAPGDVINNALKSIPAGARGLRYIEDASSKQALSILSVMMQYVKCFEYMTNFEGNFSIAEWLENGKGMIFIANYPDIKETLKPILSLFIDLLSRKFLAMKDSDVRSIFIVLTEFGTLQRLSSVVDLFTNVRSKGGKCYLDIQDYGQIDKQYGKDNRQSILSACGNSVTFAVGDEASEIASKRLGDAEYIEIVKSSSMGVDSLKDGVSFSERKVKEWLFLPSEVIDFPELTGIVRFANYGMLKTKLNWVEYPVIHEPFQMIDEVSLETVVEFEEEIVRQREEMEKDGLKQREESSTGEKEEEVEDLNSLSN